MQGYTEAQFTDLHTQNF